MHAGDVPLVFFQMAYFQIAPVGAIPLVIPMSWYNHNIDALHLSTSRGGWVKPPLLPFGQALRTGLSSPGFSP